MRRTAQAQGRICLGRKVTLRAQTKERLSATKNENRMLLTEDSGPHLPILGGLDVFTVNVSIRVQ